MAANMDLDEELACSPIVDGDTVIIGGESHVLNTGTNILSLANEKTEDIDNLEGEQMDEETAYEQNEEDDIEVNEILDIYRSPVSISDLLFCNVLF